MTHESPISFLDPQDIAHWGLKAASVMFFKSQGLYSQPVTCFDHWESREQIISQLKADGLRAYGLGMSARFSARAGGLYQIHRWALRTYEAVADFIETHKEKFAQGAFIVNETAVPEFMGNFLKRKDGTYHVEMVPGTWITSGVEPADYAEITGSAITFYAYQLPRRVCGKLEEDARAEVIMGKFVPRVDPPYSDALVGTLAEKLVSTSQKLTALELPPLLYEFNMNADMAVHIREVKEVDEDALQSTVRHSEKIHEIDAYEKLAAWDGVTPLYFTVGVEKSNADKFQMAVQALKGRTDRVYVKYGMLTHPAIVLREAGIMPVSLRTQYKRYEFVFAG